MKIGHRVGLALAASALAMALAFLHHRFVPEAVERIDLHGTWRVIARENNGQQYRAYRIGRANLPM